MSTTTTVPTITDVIKLLNEGGWRLMGGKIVREAYRAEHRENLPPSSKAKIHNDFFTESRRIYIGSASLDESGQIVVHVYANRTPIKVDPDECREICSGVLVEPQVELFDRGSKDYYGAKDGTPKRIDIRAKFPETVQEKKRYRSLSGAQTIVFLTVVS